MKYLNIALGEYGKNEIIGSEDNQDIVNYFKVVGHSWVKDDDTAWCAAFVGYCLEKAGIRSTRKLNARSYLNFGTPTPIPSVGDLVVFWRGSRDGWQGHVGFFIREEGNNIYVLGGNQSNSVSIQKYNKSRLLGYRKVTSNNSNLIKRVTDLERVNRILKDFIISKFTK